MKLPTILLSVAASVIGTLCALHPLDLSRAGLDSRSPQQPVATTAVPVSAVVTMTEPVSSKVEQQLAALTKQLASMQSEIASLHGRLESQADAVAEAARVQDRSSTPGVPERIDTATLAEQEQSVHPRQSLESMVGQLQLEERDDAWANTIENGITRILGSDLSGDLQITGIDCRASLCQASVVLGQVSEDLLPHILSSVGISGASVFNTAEAGTYDVVLNR